MEAKLLHEIEELLNNMKKFQSKLSYIDSVRDDSDKIREMKDIVIDKAGDFWDTFNKHSKYTKDNFDKNNLKFNDIEKNIFDLKNNFNNSLNTKIEELNNSFNAKTEELNKKSENINSSLKEELNKLQNKLSSLENDFNNSLNTKIEELNNSFNIKTEELNKKSEENISKLNKKLLLVSIFSPIISIIFTIIILKMNIY